MTVTLPRLTIVFRGAWCEVDFLSEATGGAVWWLVVPPALPLDLAEQLRIDRLVYDELARRQQRWRAKAGLRRSIAPRPDRVLADPPYGGDAA